MNLETQIQRRILTAWTKVLNGSPHRLCAFPNSVFGQGKRGTWEGIIPGNPDLVLYGENGMIYFFEVKTPSHQSKLSDAQKRQHHLLKSLGHHVFVVRSVSDFLDVATTLPNSPYNGPKDTHESLYTTYDKICQLKHHQGQLRKKKVSNGHPLFTKTKLQIKELRKQAKLLEKELVG